ncbi:hypothetical protein EST38_g4334 [Candolleomyces aberdarensis]|uniref:NADP-dependent oxidoreductase domain-containing protein n=1 Tax=Candolleomyces aberdarensis TaxID=2316362 RepID=A0A4Q2DN84_9AGAR|nr:hypothetical protein EST38_g4334 [Candolleomyces aberdarensis]
MSIAEAFPPAPAPRSKLGVYRQLSTLAGVRVSPLCLGGLGIGDSSLFKYNLGEITKESSFKLLDAYFDLGGNFLDTANWYGEQTSEMFMGEWAEKRGIRDQLFIATKYSVGWPRYDPTIQQKILYAGNGTKSIRLSVEASLKKLRTSYIDLLYVHFYDFSTSVEELMQALHAVVLRGQALYLGISDAPAWVVSQANQYARDHALTPFSVYQGPWSILDRSLEREIIPMARSQGMALAPWGVLAGGKIRSDAEEKQRLESGTLGRGSADSWKRTPDEKKISDALEKVAVQVGAKSLNAVAIAYLMHKTRYVFPIIGGRKVEHLQDNVEALDIALTKDHITFLESILPFDKGFPTAFIGDGTGGETPFIRASGWTSEWPVAGPIVGSRDELKEA